MRHLRNKQAIILAALLQVLPMVRNIVTSPAATSTFAIILRWGIGTTAAVGAYDAFAAASAHFMPLQTNVVMTVGTYYTNNIIVTNTGMDPGAYFELTNRAGLDSGQIVGGGTTTVCLPPGITLKCFDTANNYLIRAAVYGTPTAVMAISRVSVDAGYSGATDVFTNMYYTVIAGGAPPGITNNPANVTVNAGSNATFSVTSGGTAPLSYQWYFNTNTAVLNATNATLTLTNVQLSNAGYYRVAITNAFGSTNSSNALLTVWVPPFITSQPGGSSKVAGSQASFAVVAGGTPAVSYQWKYNTTGTVAGAASSSFSIGTVRASQAGVYTVVVTNAAGSLTSAPATLTVTAPAPPPIDPSSVSVGGGIFQFKFIPVPGLTNTVLTNSAASGGNWAALVNVPPPPSTNAITITDAVGTSNQFYRVQVLP